ncbi:hypothetical protein [Kaistia sp. MMO-174]|uniref:hypothetical protein n=1 Tax=Kaistia sp. MMO-174 TaxID=3081256 RepID=UPI0030190331
MTAAVKAARHPVGEINVPTDIEQYGINHGIPEFANAVYRSGYVDGHRAALGLPEDVMHRLRRGESVTLADLTADDEDPTQ